MATGDFLPAFNVFFSHRADKGYKKADSRTKEKLKGLFETLSENPVPVKYHDVTKISGSESNYRVRLADYRVIYTVFWTEKLIKMHDIGKRKDRTYG